MHAECQKIAHDWATNKLFQARFNAIYWLSLRALNAAMEGQGCLHGIVDPVHFFARAIARFLLENEELTPYVADQLQNHPHKILIILDGYDEAHPPLSQTVQLLLQKKNLSLLLTSRPVAAEFIPIKETVETIGFKERIMAAFIKLLGFISSTLSLSPR